MYITHSASKSVHQSYRRDICWCCSRSLVLVLSSHRTHHLHHRHTTITISRMKYGWYHCTKNPPCRIPSYYRRSVYFNRNRCLQFGGQMLDWHDNILSIDFIAITELEMGDLLPVKSTGAFSAFWPFCLLIVQPLRKIDTAINYIEPTIWWQIREREKKFHTTFCSTIRLLTNIYDWIQHCMPYVVVIVILGIDTDGSETSKLALTSHCHVWNRVTIDTKIHTQSTHIQLLHPYYMRILDFPREQTTERERTVSIFYSACVHIFERYDFETQTKR